MDKIEIISKVVDTVIQVQEVSGRAGVEVSGSTRPVGGIEGFDSLNGLEATIMLSASLGIDIPEACNPFVSKDGSRATTVSEIADDLSSYAKTGVASG